MFPGTVSNLARSCPLGFLRKSVFRFNFAMYRFTAVCPNNLSGHLFHKIVFSCENTGCLIQNSDINNFEKRKTEFDEQAKDNIELYFF